MLEEAEALLNTARGGGEVRLQDGVRGGAQRHTELNRPVEAHQGMPHLVLGDDLGEYGGAAALALGLDAAPQALHR